VRVGGTAASSSWSREDCRVALCWRSAPPRPRRGIVCAHLQHSAACAIGLPLFMRQLPGRQESVVPLTICCRLGGSSRELFCAFKPLKRQFVSSPSDAGPAPDAHVEWLNSIFTRSSGLKSYEHVNDLHQDPNNSIVVVRITTLRYQTFTLLNVHGSLLEHNSSRPTDSIVWKDLTTDVDQVRPA
jgi:hypothetical protein